MLALVLAPEPGASQQQVGGTSLNVIVRFPCNLFSSPCMQGAWSMEEAAARLVCCLHAAHRLCEAWDHYHFQREESERLGQGKAKR